MPAQPNCLAAPL